MSCEVNELRHVPLFSLLDEEEMAVLAAQVETREFAANQRIYKAGDTGSTAYVMIRGAVRVVLLDEDGQEIVFAEPRHGDIFGFASMLESTEHKTTAYATEASTCLELDRNDLGALFEKKPMAGLDMLTVLAREIHSAQQMVKERSAKSPNELIDADETFGERIADKVAGFGGSWTFIILFAVVLSIYTVINIALKGKAWDPYPFILLNLFLSMLAAIQAPVIMMSQNRQDQRDRVRSEMDFDVNRRSETEIKELARRLNLLHEQVGDLDERLRVDSPETPDQPKG
jgi:CRP/FNR family cyclic AMP-dependent transcriptional regulator